MERRVAKAGRKVAEPLPKMLPGSLCKQWVRCGKAGCHCARGELHGPYYYRFWREGGQLRKEYVRRENVEGVKAACAALRRSRWEMQQAVSWLRGQRSWLKNLERIMGSGGGE